MDDPVEVWFGPEAAVHRFTSLRPLAISQSTDAHIPKLLHKLRESGFETLPQVQLSL